MEQASTAWEMVGRDGTARPFCVLLLRRLGSMLKEATRAYTRSTRERVVKKTRVRKGRDGEIQHTESILEKHDRDGDPRFLRVAVDIIAEMNELRGAHAAVQAESATDGLVEDATNAQVIDAMKASGALFVARAPIGTTMRQLS